MLASDTQPEADSGLTEPGDLNAASHDDLPDRETNRKGE